MNIQKETLSGVLRWVLEVVFVIGIIVIVTLRYILSRYYSWFFSGDAFYFNFVLGVLYLSGAAALVIIRRLIYIFKTIVNKNPFVESNVKSLRYISYSCLFIAGVFIVKWFVYASLITLVAIGVFTIASLAALVFSQLFNQAVGYKSENDFTI